MTLLLTVLTLLVCCLGLAILARRLDVPAAVLLTLGGIVASFVPGPELSLDPQFTLAFFLPPILQAAAYSTPWREFRFNLRPILLLALGLVLVTTVVIGAALKWLVPELPWAVCFAFGAIVSPPDAVAATSVLERIGAPRRVVSVLEGESLLNDASGLVLYGIAVAAAVDGQFSPAGALGELVLLGAGGVALGLAFGYGTVWLLKRLDDTLIETLLSLLVAYASFLAAETVHVSAVLSTVACGLVIGWHAPTVMSPRTRLEARASWELIVFVLNSLVFILIGLQLDDTLARLGGWREVLELIGYGLVLSLVAVLIRFAYVFPATYLPRWLSPSLAARDPAPPWQAVVMIAWLGMRGVVSLAAALALPTTTADGSAFPGRDLVLFLTFVVIVTTLVGQALAAPHLIRRLRIPVSALASTAEHESAVRLRLADAAVSRLRELAADPLEGAMVQDILPDYLARAAHEGESGTAAAEARRVARLRYRLDAAAAERSELMRLHREHAVQDLVFVKLLRDLDYEELRLRRRLAE